MRRHFCRDLDALGRGRSAVILRFVMRDFHVKIKSFTGGYVSETEQKATAVI